jgi:competence protein ComEC
MGCLTMAILFCICGIPITILSPSIPSSIAIPTPINITSTQPLAVNTAVTESDQATYVPSSTNTSERINTSVPARTSAPLNTPILFVTATLQPSTLASIKVHFIDVGQGDSVLIQAPGGESVLIDGGEADSGAVQYLQRLGITHLNLVIATHPHSDHIGGLVQVLNTIPVDEVITNGVMHTTLTYEHFLDAITASKAKYMEAKRGDTISLGDLNFNVLSPISNTDEDLNNGSLVLRLVYGKVSFLFTGDAQQAAEDSMIGSGLDVSATILKVAHHGSRNGSPLEFLTAVHPQIAIYSAGLGNDYGHPHPETIAALKSIGAVIYGTDVNGTVIVTTDGNEYSIETTKLTPTQLPSIIVQPTSEQPTKLFINVVSLTSPITAGGIAKLTINTFPGAACTITVYYKSGASQAAGLGPQTANSNGDVTWSWKVGSRTTPGTWRIVVTAKLNEQSISTEIPFEVR